jgi:hypothetical protein
VLVRYVQLTGPSLTAPSGGLHLLGFKCRLSLFQFTLSRFRSRGKMDSTKYEDSYLAAMLVHASSNSGRFPRLMGSDPGTGTRLAST